MRIYKSAIEFSVIKLALTAMVIVASVIGLSARVESRMRSHYKVNWSVAGNIYVRAIHVPPCSCRPVQAQSELAEEGARLAIPVAGFVPYVGVALTDQRQFDDFQWAHVVADTVVGASLNAPMAQNYVFGVLDTGATVNVVGWCDRTKLGLTDAWLSGNTVLVGLPGHQVNVSVTQPMGIFVAGTQAIDRKTLALNTANLSGHWNVSAIVSPPETCGDTTDIPSAVGTALLSFRNVVIHNEVPRRLVRDLKVYYGPEVEVYSVSDRAAPHFPNVVPLNARPAALTAAAYYSDGNQGDYKTPVSPTALTVYEGANPSGGWFVAGVRLRQGAGGGFTRSFLVSTGSQVSVIGSSLAGQLGLDLAHPAFTVNVTGIAGDVTVAPGFYIDSFEITTTGPAIALSHVPIIVLDVPSVEGGTLDGIIGTNVFFNRSLVLRPNLGGSSVLEVSAPLAFGDCDADGDVDLADFGHFRNCFNGSNRPPAQDECENMDCDQDSDVDLVDFGRFRNCFNGSNRPPACAE